MLKLDERVRAMRRLCDHVRSAAAPLALPIVRRAPSVRRVVLLVTVDDIPLPEPEHDYIDGDGTLRLHFQSVGTADRGSTLFPDFVFGGWWHIGLHDFDAFSQAMISASAAPATRNQAFWIGNVAMSPFRAELVALSQAHPSRIDARGMQWAHARGNVSEATGERAATDGWVSLPHHAAWRYLIDIEGMGWSGRLKLLPFSRRPLLIQDGDDRPYWDWATARLRPHVHYLPVRRDLSDLLAQIEWLDAHPTEANGIADAAFELATTHFSFAAAVRHGANLTLTRLQAVLAPPRAPSEPRTQWERRLRRSKKTPAGPLVNAASHEPRDPPAAEAATTCSSSEMDNAFWSDPALSSDAREAAQAEAETLVAGASSAVRAAASRPTTYSYRGRLIHVYALSNSIPDHAFVPMVPAKSRTVATNLPGNASTYAFHDEQSYLDDYRGSLYGVTRKKTGWDAARHLEIMASGAIPLFLDVHDLPPQTLALYPRAWIADAEHLTGVAIRRRAASRTDDPRWYLDHSAFSVDVRVLNASAFVRLAARVLAHARRHLSSSGMAAHVLAIMGLDADAATPLLFVTHCSSDFTGDSLLYGLKVLLGADAVTDVAYDTDGAEHPWCRPEARAQRRKRYLYDPSVDYAHDADNRSTPSRFCIGGRHPDSPRVRRDDIEARIQRHEFGAVIYGSAARTTAHLPLVSRVYARERVGLVYGEDIPLPLGSGLPMEGVQRPDGSPPTVPSMAEASQWGVIFARELFDSPADEPWKHQTIMVPGVADRVERGWQKPVRWPLDVEQHQ